MSRLACPDNLHMSGVIGKLHGLSNARFNGHCFVVLGSAPGSDARIAVLCGAKADPISVLSEKVRLVVDPSDLDWKGRCYATGYSFFFYYGY